MSKDGGLKSSFDLAMERMAQRGESITTLSDEKKAALAEISAAPELFAEFLGPEIGLADVPRALAAGGQKRVVRP